MRPDVRFALVPEWLLIAPISNRAFRLYCVLATFADYNTGEATPGRKLLARRMGDVSLDTVDRAKKELVKVGAISVEARQAAAGDPTSNTYIIHREHPDRRTAEVRPPLPQPSGDPGRTDAATKRNENQENDKTSTPAELRVRIEQTWLSSEGMISHRESYFADAKVRRAIDRAVKTYGADDVCAAITSYAAVLASPSHRWSHRWTLLDFLTRGLDRFVPEAEPEVVFRDNGVAGGRAGNDNAEDDGLDYLNT